MFASSLARAPQRRKLLAGIAAIAATTGLSLAAQDAQAAFTIPQCAGSSSVAAQGASFQTDAQAFWRDTFTSSNGCGKIATSTNPSPPTYKGNGSGNGLAAVGNGNGAGGATGINCATVATNGVTCTTPTPAGFRDPSTSVASTDEPPTAEQVTRINNGDPSTTADNGVIHVIPAATGASTVIVNLPNGCNVTGVDPALKTNGADGTVGAKDTGDSENTGTSRLRLTNATIERIFAGDSNAQTWGDIAPGLSGTPTSDQHAAGITCAAVPIKRIVRFDESGTTYGFKAYLNLVDRTNRGWLTTYVGPNTRWPAGNGSSTAVTPTAINPAAVAPAVRYCPDSDANKLCSSTSGNATNLSNLVAATDGAIGYADLATARARSFDIAALPATNPATNQQAVQTDDTYWMPLQNNPAGAATGFVEPTTDAKAHTGGIGSKGAACSTAPITGAPTPATSPGGDPTLGSWGATAAAGGPGYPACVLTYILAWDDNAPVYGNNATEQAKARTVKDFLTEAVLTGFGQSFTAFDYSALPQVLLDDAKIGANAINWNKSADVVVPPTPQPQPGPPAPGPPVPTTPVPPPVTIPSNAFTVGTGKVNAARTSLAFSLKLPGAGKLVAAATFKSGSKTVKIATLNATTTAAGTVKVTVKLNAAARSALKKKKKLTVSVKFTFTPNGGAAKASTKTSTFRPAKKKKSTN